MKKEIAVDAVGVVTNGMNIEDFEVLNKKHNDPPVISMIYSTHPAKGMPDGFAVLQEIKKRHPQVKDYSIWIYKATTS